MKGHSIIMILINVASRIRAAINDPVLDRQIEESIAILRKDFMHPEFKALLETVGPNGEFIDTNATRTINPGHCIETSWFILEEAKNRNWDKEMVDTALTILYWSWEWGWDKEYGGIINFRDCRNLPSQDYAHDMKFWWPRPKRLSQLYMRIKLLKMKNIWLCINRSVTGLMPIFLMQSLVNGMGISIVTERFLSLRKEICLRDHSTFLE